jgi:glycosyltransferase involved in cell wall biosynthesis
LFCGKFIPKKRPLDLVKAAALLMKDGRLPKLHLLFTGSGELGPELRAACHVVFDAETLNFQLSTFNMEAPRASFAGFLNQTQISEAYIAADCLVLPSDYGETWGLVVNEAMASGLPCVISDHCGSAEDLGTKPPNQTFPFGDCAALADCLCKLAEAEVNRTAPPQWLDSFSFQSSVQTVADSYAIAQS